MIENFWRRSERVGVSLTSTLPSLHRVSRVENGEEKWQMHLTSEARANVITKSGAAIACIDGSLHLIDIETGEHVLPAIQLRGKPSSVIVQDQYLIVTTSDASISIWDFDTKKKILMESIKHLGKIMSVYEAMNSNFYFLCPQLANEVVLKLFN